MRVAKSHHHVELDVHEYMHNAKLNEQSSLGECRRECIQYHAQSAEICLRIRIPNFWVKCEAQEADQVI